MKRLIGMAMLVLVLVAPPGCNQAQIDSIKQDLGLVAEQIGPMEAALVEVIEQKAELDQEITTMEPGDEKDDAIALSKSMGHVVDVSQEILEKGKEAMTGLQERIATAEDEIDVVGAVAKTAIPFLPPPWNAAAAAGIGLAIGLWRAAKNLKAGRELAKSVDPIVASALNENSDVKRDLLIAQTPAVKKLVDEAQSSSILKRLF